MTSELREELAHLFEVEAQALQDRELAAIAAKIRESIMSTEEKKQDLEIGGIMKMSTLKKLVKVALVAGLGFFIGRRTA